MTFNPFTLVGGLVRDTVELLDSTLEVIKDIPDDIAAGYNNGCISNGDNQPSDIAKQPTDSVQQTEPEK